MEKTRNKAKKFSSLDKLGQRILHIARSIAKERKDRAELDHILNQTTPFP